MGPGALPTEAFFCFAVATPASGPVTAETVARTFLRARTDKVAELLTTLAAIGQAREVEPGTYVC